MAGIDAGVEDFLSAATETQAALLGAACVERASGVLFWIVSRDGDGRAEDLKIYKEALEFIWAKPLAGDLRPPVASRDIEELRELVVGDEATGAAAFAFQPAIAVRAMLEFHETAKISSVRDCLLTCYNQAFFLKKRTGSDTLAAEEAALTQDVAALTQGRDSVADTAARLRPAAQAVARDRLAAAVARYGD